MKYIGFSMIHSTSIPNLGPKRNNESNSPGIQQGFLSPLPSADFPSKLGMQNKRGVWNIQYNQCSPAAHTDIAHTITVLKSIMLMVEKTFA